MKDWLGTGKVADCGLDVGSVCCRKNGGRHIWS